MTTNRECMKKRKIATLITSVLFCLPGLSHADDDAAAAQQAKAMALNLIQALVDSGTLTQEKADKLIASAQAKTRAQVSASTLVGQGTNKSGPGSEVTGLTTPSAPVAVAQTKAQAQALAIAQSKVQILAQALAEAEAAQARQIADIQAEQAAAEAAAKAAAETAAADRSGRSKKNDSGIEFKSRFAESGSRRSATATPPAPVVTEPVAEPSAQVVAAPVPVAEIPASPVMPLPVVTDISPATTPDAGADGKRVVHVAYVPEATRREMREQIKADVLAQSKAERWGQPGALPDWLDRITISGDVRVRNEFVKLSHDNTPAGVDFSDGVFTRAANIVGSSFSGNQSPFDTQNNYDFWSLRARLNIEAKVSDKVATGLTLSTGNTNQRTTTSQNLGQNFNYYSVVIDKAFIKYDPASWFSLSAGRITNPFFSSDLLFADDLNFEGVAIGSRFSLSPTVTPFITAGWFPLRMDSPGTSTARNLGAIQAGVDWAVDKKTQVKFGTAIYDFTNIAGTAETEAAYQAGVSDYVSRYEYPAGFRQMGNTLFVINAPTDPNINWGLASKFKEIDAIASMDFAHFDPVHVVLTTEYVKNIGYKTNDIFERTGYTLKDGKNTGNQEKIQIGAPIIKARGDWNVSLAYRYLGSDAVLDAFVNPDFGLGSTNTKGTIFTANYGIDKNTWMTGRFLSSSLIDSMVPQYTHTGTIPPVTKLNADVLQVELNARF